MSILDVLRSSTLTDAFGPLSEGYAQAADSRLVAQMCEGDIRAFEAIFARYATVLAQRAEKYLQSADLARDVSQEVFLKLLNDPPERLKDGQLGPWLFRVAKNLAIDRARRRKFEVSTGETGAMTSERLVEDNPASQLSASNDAALIRGCVNQLSPELKQIVELRIDQNLAFKDIAERLQIPMGTAIWRMHHAVELLRGMWRKAGG